MFGVCVCVSGSAPGRSINKPCLIVAFRSAVIGTHTQRHRTWLAQHTHGRRTCTHHIHLSKQASQMFVSPLDNSVSLSPPGWSFSLFYFFYLHSTSGTPFPYFRSSLLKNAFEHLETAARSIPGARHLSESTASASFAFAAELDVRGITK